MGCERSPLPAQRPANSAFRSMMRRWLRRFWRKRDGTWERESRDIWDSVFEIYCSWLTAEGMGGTPSETRRLLPSGGEAPDSKPESNSLKLQRELTRQTAIFFKRLKSTSEKFCSVERQNKILYYINYMYIFIKLARSKCQLRRGNSRH